ncbi:hypothetical protein CLM62_12980 [Streptomyces sp. SA15]|uniref:hypothetical protein n=1 Tax=Streptomyces sp. SA15 TaxID=934019 RepID=UPI000BB0A5B7|nr:hypothetical protein [Streptomyces sp. SA15]PAZ15704.1 hypothetical protein CLM62_12980 [Streptomyces sp. SA15]
MNGWRDADSEDERIAPACRLGECGHCSGNIDLKSGPGPAVPLLRCAHVCHGGRVLVRHA